MSSEPDMREAIATLYELYRHDIYRYARFTLGDEASAQDVVQEVFMRTIRSWHLFRHDSNVKTWLLSIARNHMYDVLRKRNKWQKFVGGRDDASVTPDVSLSVEINMVLEQALLSLKDTYRQVFVLRHIESLTVQEAAHVLGWSEGKVRTTDYRAIAKLRELLEMTFQEVNA